MPDAVVDAKADPEASQPDLEWCRLYGRVLEQELADQPPLASASPQSSSSRKG